MAFDIEKIVKEKRHQIDVETPPDSLWDGIENKIEIPQKPEKKDYSWVWKVAASLFLVTSIVLLALLVSKPGDQEPQLASLSDISSEYKSIETEYISVIQMIESELKVDEEHRKEFPWLFEELEYLEVVNTQYREDLSKVSENEQVIKPLIDYYEKKIKILKRIQLEINRKNNEKDDQINI